MDKNQKTEYLEGIEEYLEEYKVYDYFYELMKELITHRPKDPIDYLIQRISKSECYRSLIVGPPGFSRLGLGESVAEKIGWKYLNFSEWVAEDEEVQREKDQKMVKKVPKRENKPTKVISKPKENEKPKEDKKPEKKKSEDKKEDDKQPDKAGK